MVGVLLMALLTDEAKKTRVSILYSFSSSLNVNIHVSSLVFNDLVPTLSLLFKLQRLHPVLLIIKIFECTILLAGSSEPSTIILLVSTLATVASHFLLRTE